MDVRRGTYMYAGDTFYSLRLVLVRIFSPYKTHFWLYKVELREVSSKRPSKRGERDVEFYDR